MEVEKDIEMVAAKKAAEYIEKQFTQKDKEQYKLHERYGHTKDIEYNLIIVCSGDVGPERKMMNILKEKKYQLKNVWLVDVYCPSDEII